MDDIQKVGVVFLAAGIVGGGLKAFGVDIPLIHQKGRQILLGLLGLVLVAWPYFDTSKEQRNQLTEREVELLREKAGLLQKISKLESDSRNDKPIPVGDDTEFVEQPSKTNEQTSAASETDDDILDRLEEEMKHAEQANQAKIINIAGNYTDQTGGYYRVTQNNNFIKLDQLYLGTVVFQVTGHLEGRSANLKQTINLYDFFGAGSSKKVNLHIPEHSANLLVNIDNTFQFELQPAR
ncbi:MAG: hypothetical protein AAFX87_18310 [Bacteroidota bacterium]